MSRLGNFVWSIAEAEPGIGVVGEAGDGRTGLAAARRLRPHVTLLDHRMPVADGLSVVEQVAACSYVLVLTNSPEEELVAPMLRGGARGYLAYGQFTPPDLIAAVRAVAAGQGWLVPSAASVATTALREAHARRRVRSTACPTANGRSSSSWARDCRTPTSPTSSGCRVTRCATI